MTLPRWQSLTTRDVQALAGRDAVLVLPLGATEQHGPHLPLSTDVDIALGLIEQAERLMPGDFPAAVLPPLTVGASQEHACFHGTLSLGPETLIDLIAGVGSSLARSGFRRLVLCNAHGGNLPALDAGSLILRERHALLVVKTSYFLAPPPAGVELPASEWRHGIHGGAVETAMMMHLAPARVRMDAIEDTRSLGEDLDRTMRIIGPEAPGASFAWLACDLSATGVTGNPRLATAAIGARLVEYYGKLLADALLDARAFPLDRLVTSPPR